MIAATEGLRLIGNLFIYIRFGRYAVQKWRFLLPFPFPLRLPRLVFFTLSPGADSSVCTFGQGFIAGWAFGEWNSPFCTEWSLLLCRH